MIENVTLYTLRDGETIAYAAAELARCLARMDDVQVIVRGTDGYRPQEQKGLYLGLLDDVGIDARTTTTEWDDRVHVEVSGLEGVIAGANARSKQAAGGSGPERMASSSPVERQARSRSGWTRHRPTATGECASRER
jgi:hypothetical protein